MTTKRWPERVKGVVVAAEVQRPAGRRSAWCFADLAGRLVEVSGGPDTAALTLAAGLVHETQVRGEPVAWIATADSLFYPPDFAARGIDLGALPIVRVDKGLAAARAADALLRSGGFGAVVLDLGVQQNLSLSVQTRLSGLARRHGAVVLILTRRVRAERSGAPQGSLGSGSLGSLVSLWGECSRRRSARDRFACELVVRKDKRCGEGWRHVEYCRGPDGLC